MITAADKDKWWYGKAPVQIVPRLIEENQEQAERIKELTEALVSLAPFASEVVARQKNENVFGYNGEMLTLTQLKKVLSVIKK